MSILTPCPSYTSVPVTSLIPSLAMSRTASALTATADLAFACPTLPFGKLKLSSKYPTRDIKN